MNFKKRVNGSWTDIPHYIHNTSTDTLTTLPADIYANDTTATVGLKGDMSQSPQPSTTNPIQPSECGERTGNLLNRATDITGYRLGQDGSLFRESGYETSEYISVEPSSEIRRNIPLMTVKPLCEYDANKEFIKRNTSGGVIVLTSNTHYIRISISISDIDVMLYTGSTSLPYEPYGYKIPISSADTTTNNYLGEVQSTRRIKKLVLDGTENRWNKSGAYQGSFYLAAGAADAVSLSYQAYCSHATFTTLDQYTRNTFCFNGSPINLNLWIGESSWTTDDFKAYLAQQYANGTPVTVWYVLATPQAAVVNEPLRKIGDYADEVSGITIPTIAGADSFDVLTTLKPSEVTATYKGWHPVQSVHERESGQWD